MTTTHKILVVDGDPTGIGALSQPLEEAGYEVLCANDGFQAEKLAAEQLPDLILLDLSFPKLNCLEVCRRLKAQETTSSIPVICVTDRSDPDQITSVFAAGGVDHITRPIQTDEMLSRVSVHIRLCEAERIFARKRGLDPLTGLLDRVAWEELSLIEHHRSLRHQHTYSVVRIHLDHFKLFRNTLGDTAWDDCLRRVATSIKSACRTIDLIGRFGDGDFVVLLPETMLEGACIVAGRILVAVRDLTIEHPGSTTYDCVTASLGVSQIHSDSLDEVIKDADKALSDAKTHGRNCVWFIDPTAPSGSDSATKPANTSGLQDTVPESIPSVSFVITPDFPDTASVLIVDDNPTNRVLCKGCLKREGYRIREACDGYEALAEVERECPDVIIMDVMMPRMDGLECIRRLRENPVTHDIPIIVLSAKSDKDDILAGLSTGAEDYLIKPIRTDELLIRVRSMVRLHRKHKSLIQSYEVRGEQTRILSLALDYCRLLGTSSELDEVLQHTIAATSQMTGCGRVSIMLPDADQSSLRIAASIGIDSEIAEKVRVPIGEAVAGSVFESGQAVVVNAQENDTYVLSKYETFVFSSVPLLSMPVEAADQIVGVLNMTDRRGGRSFTPQELEYIDLIAGVAGSAIHNIINRQARDDARDSIVLALAKLAEHRDSDTGKHLDRVTRYCLMLAEELRTRPEFQSQIDDAFLHALARAAPIHDIGKVAIPDHILLKPGKLTPDEMAIMQTHAQVGADTIRSLIEENPGIPFLVLAEEIAAGHHEWVDGSGYPSGLRGSEIPLSARILAVADVYDALRTERPYKKSFSHEKARQIITRSKGVQFDSDVVNAFLVLEDQFIALSGELADPSTRPDACDSEDGYNEQPRDTLPRVAHTT